MYRPEVSHQPPPPSPITATTATATNASRLLNSQRCRNGSRPPGSPGPLAPSAVPYSPYPPYPPLIMLVPLNGAPPVSYRPVAEYSAAP